MSRLNRYVFPAALGLLLAAGCSKPESSPATGATEPATGATEPATEPAKTEVKTEPTAPAIDAAVAAAAEPAAEPTETRVIRLDPSELRETDTKGIHKYCLDCRVKKAKYTYCHFDMAELTKVVGADKLKDDVRLTVEMAPLGSENWTPKNPQVAKPEGGFTHLMFACRATGLAPEE